MYGTKEAKTKKGVKSDPLGPLAANKAGFITIIAC